MKALIYSDSELYGDYLQLMFGQINPDIKIIQRNKLNSAIEVIKNEKLDIIVMCIDYDILDHIGKIQKIDSNTNICVVSNTENSDDIRKIYDTKVKGCLKKVYNNEVLTKALKLVIDGGKYFPVSIIDNILDNNSKHINNCKSLSLRQSEVLNYLRQGLSNKDISNKMCMSEQTIKLHINSLLRIFDVTNRTHAVIKAEQLGYFNTLQNK